MGGWHNDHQMKVPDIHLAQNNETFSLKQDFRLANYKLYTHSQKVIYQPKVLAE